MITEMHFHRMAQLHIIILCIDFPGFVNSTFSMSFSLCIIKILMIYVFLNIYVYKYRILYSWLSYPNKPQRFLMRANVSRQQYIYVVSLANAIIWKIKLH